MLQITTLRLLLCSPNSNSLLSHLKPTRLSVSSSYPLLSRPRSSSFVTVLCSSSRRQRNICLTRRGNCSLREIKSKDKVEKVLVMEETESMVFNKRRADGSDQSDRNKNLQLKSRKLNPISTICYVQILGTGMDTQDTSPSVLLFFDKQRFIFNAGEGLQRFCTEHKIKLSKIDHIFLSRVCSETAGGLPGLLLTLAGIGETGMSVNIWGPSDLDYLVKAMSFIPKAAMVHTHSFGFLPGSDGVGIPDKRRFTDPVVVLNDEVVKISAILLRPGHLDRCHSNERSTLLNSSEMDLIDWEQFSESSLSRSSNSIAEPVKPGDISVIYLCELPEIRGKFDPEKAKALGLKPGPKYRELQLGNSVKSDLQNIMVHPTDVLGPSILGPIVLLVDCPTASHMQELLSIQSLSSYYADFSGNVPECRKTVNCVIHLTPMCIASTPDYQKWMKRFGGAQHIMAGHEMKNAEAQILKSSVRVATRLNYLCPQFFPASGLWSLQHPNYLKPDLIVPIEGTISELCCISAKNLLKFHLRPYTQLGLDRSGIPDLMAPSEIINELLSEIPDIINAADQVRQFCHGSKETKVVIPGEDDRYMVEEPWLNGNTDPSCLEGITREDMEIVLLGTGSSQPSKYRNVTSIYINLFSKGSLLFDCGEGTLAQLGRRFGLEGADDAVRALRLIWISHIHADHHTGLARILALRRNLLKGTPHEPLHVIGPAPLKKFLDAYQRLEDLDMQFLDCRQTTKASLAAFESDCEQNKGHSDNFVDVNQTSLAGPSTQSIETTLFAKGSPMQSYWKRQGSPISGAVSPILKELKEVLGDAGLEALISFPVVHCPQAFGVVLKASERINCAGKVIPGWKIVYSGDTRPCPELIEASRGATVLIHEATFEEDMLEEAIQKNHSTTKEAIEVGTSAGAYRIILTHFSQRYPKIPVFDERHMDKTCIAFDLMSINLADLDVLPKVLPYLKLLFKNEVEADELDDSTSTANAVAT